MAIHKSRSGERMVCWPCQQGECDWCMGTDEDLPIVCHHSCQPECIGCRPTKNKRRAEEEVGQMCPECFTEKPSGGGPCGVCG